MTILFTLVAIGATREIPWMKDNKNYSGIVVCCFSIVIALLGIWYITIPWIQSWMGKLLSCFS